MSQSRSQGRRNQQRRVPGSKPLLHQSQQGRSSAEGCASATPLKLRKTAGVRPYHTAASVEKYKSAPARAIHNFLHPARKRDSRMFQVVCITAPQSICRRVWAALRHEYLQRCAGEAFPALTASRKVRTCPVHCCCFQSSFQGPFMGLHYPMYDWPIMPSCPAEACTAVAREECRCLSLQCAGRQPAHPPLQ